MKSLSELEARKAFGDDRTIVVRPTYIVGPGDTSNRFPYWPVRMDRGGETLVPGKADDPVQFIDVRDLTEWMIRLAEQQASGTFNVAGPASPLGMHEFTQIVHDAVGSTGTLVHVDDYDFLLEHRLQFAVPWIMPTDDYVGSARINNQRAVANGLTFRPLDQITRDVLGWWNTDAVDEERRKRLVSGPRSLMAREPEILAAWSARM
jgi:2'-hydroxyisoflavone reductase